MGKRLIIALWLAVSISWCGTAYGQEPDPLVPGTVYECVDLATGFTYIASTGAGGGSEGTTQCTPLGLDPGPISIDGVEQEIPYEDEPGWECEIMGNRICGPIKQLMRWAGVK